MSIFSLKQSAGDSNSVTDVGLTSCNSVNTLRIGPVTVPYNATIVATTAPGTTPGDTTIEATPIIYTDVIAMDFLLTVGAVHGTPPAGYIPQLYIKLVLAAGSSHDLVMPISGSNTLDSYVNPAATINSVANINQPNATYDANGAAFTLEGSAAIIKPPVLAANFTITVTPDKYYDCTIQGTIELAV